jgi:hypothetical protein
LGERVWALWHRQAEHRFDAYLVEKSEPKVNGIARYKWNVELCEALYPALHVLEVSLRCALDWSMQKKHSETWLFDPSLFLQNEAEKIATARRAIEERGRTASHDRVVAELTLGFWTGLFSEPYEHTIVRPVLAKGLKGVPAEHRNRSALAGRLKRIRDLRNRTFHFEPIWNRPDLHGDYLLVRTTCEWTSPIHCRFLLDGRRFVETYRRGWTPLAKTIQKSIDEESAAARSQ